MADELVAALGIGAGDVAGNGEDVFALLESMGGGREGARPFGGFDHYNDIGETRDEAVAIEKAGFGVDFALYERLVRWGIVAILRSVTDPLGAVPASLGGGERGIFGGDRSVFRDNGAILLNDFAGKTEVLLGVDIVNAGAENCHGDAASIQAAPVGDTVDTVGEARYDNDAFFAEFVGELVGDLLAVLGIMPGADDGDGFGA